MAIPRSDEELQALAIGGDKEAQDELRSRFLAPLYDFALRISLDPSVAEQATLAGLAGLDSTPPIAGGLSLMSGLLAAVRDDSIERLRSRGDGSDAYTPISPVDSRFSALPAGGAVQADAELASWAWQAARAQRPRDYSLLDLSVRRGLSADEIAEATEMSHSGIYAILGRLRGSFEETFTSMLLYHRGREACAELAHIAGEQPILGPSVRREIARHVEGCAACRQTRRSFASPADMLAAFEMIEPPAGLADAAGAAAPAVAESPASETSLQGALPLGAGALADAALSAATEGEGLSVDPPEEPVEAPAELEETTEGATVATIEDVATAVEPAVDEAAVAEGPNDVIAEAPEDAEGEVEAEDVEEAAGEEENAELVDEIQDEAPPPDEGPLDDEAELGGLEAEESSDERDTREVEDEGARIPAVIGAGAAISAGGRASTSTEERIRFQRDRFLAGMGGGGPPRRPWTKFKDWFDEQGPARVSFYVLIVGAVCLAAYLGLAVGNSIEGDGTGSSASGLSLLPTGTPGVRQIACGSGNHIVDQGSINTLTFDSGSLSGYQISSLGVRPVSANAIPQSVKATARPPFQVEFEALPIAGAAGRTDTYALVVTFSKPGERDVTSECTVMVRSVASPTSVAPTASPTGQATTTATRPPATNTSAPIAPTAAPTQAFTATPGPPTSTATVVATATTTRTATATPAP